MLKLTWKRISNLKNKIFILFFVEALCLGCGVKGDPLPPKEPPYIGRGKPSFKRASEEVKVPEGYYNNDYSDEEDEEKDPDEE